MIGENGVKESRSTALAMLPARFSTPEQGADIYLKFGWTPERVSYMTKAVLYHIDTRWAHLLEFDEQQLTSDRLQVFCNAISAVHNTSLQTCWGFLDGTLHSICRPSCGQEGVYNGWKRRHTLKYQGLVTPDGIIVHLAGSREGRVHDITMYRESNLPHYLERHSYNPQEEALEVYGDAAYIIGPHIITPFKGVGVTPVQHQWNAAMSKVRIVIE